MSFSRFQERSRDINDGIERHAYGEIEYVPNKGAIIRVTGTGSEDKEAILLNTGFGFNLKKDTDAEVLLLSGGSDTNQKFALANIPHDKQRQWKEGTGGVQHPLDASFALEFNSKRAHITQGKFAVGDGLFEVKDGKVFIRGDVVVSGKLTANSEVVTPVVNNGTEAIPGFEA